MEIYRNQSSRVVIDVPDPLTSYKATVRSANYETEEIPPTIADETGTAHIIVDIGFRHAAYDGIVNIEVSMDDGEGEYSWVEHVSVVTPLFTWRDLDGSYKREETPELERLVRHTIEAYTGQSFGRTRKRISVMDSQTQINLSQPLIEFTGVSERFATHSTTLRKPKISFEVLDGGFTLAINWPHYDIKTDSVWISRNRRPQCRIIEGVFGYDRVPQAVKEAALLIAGMWGCKQAVWRDRYIQTMRSADWSVTYHHYEGFSGTTGSQTADLLLSEYVRRPMPEVI